MCLKSEAAVLEEKEGDLRHRAKASEDKPRDRARPGTESSPELSEGTMFI